MSSFSETIYKQKYEQDNEGWEGTARRVVANVLQPYFPELVEETIQAIVDRKFMPAGRYLYSAGKGLNQVNNCFLKRAEDSREGWAQLLHDTALIMMTGGGLGVVYSDLRRKGAVISSTGAESSGPLALMQMVNEVGRHVMAGGSRRSALWAGLHWNHPDVFEFIRMKNWSDEFKSMKEKNFNAYAPMDQTNISIILDDDFFSAYDDSTNSMHKWAHDLYDEVISQMLTTGEPGFSVDIGENRHENLRNPCCEITSEDNDDVCNLGSINLARVETKEEFERLVYLGTHFLLAGTLYSKVPYENIGKTRAKNRRLGLGLMGIYEWLVSRGYPYGPNEELGSWLKEYEKSTEIAAKAADSLDISHPIKTRALAPTGTIAIIAETTTGIEPVFASAFKRRYLKGETWYFKYVIDSSTKRLLDKGVDSKLIEDAYDLARDPGRRLHFQAWVQQYVDHAISSTLNLPSVEEQSFTPKEFGKILMQHLPFLRGVTVYPDGARGGQPITKVDIEEAYGYETYEYEEYGNDNSCKGGVCGI